MRLSYSWSTAPVGYPRRPLSVRVRASQQAPASSSPSPQPGEPSQAPQTPPAGAAEEPPSPNSRRNIAERLKALKRQNEYLKAAIGVFLDQPADVGMRTGRPTGAWDQGGTASLLEQLSTRSPASDSQEQAAGAASPDQAEVEQPAAPLQQPGAPAADAAAAGLDAAAEVLSEADAAELGLPAGPIFDTEAPGALWSDAAAAAAAAAAEAAAAEAAAAEAAAAAATVAAAEAATAAAAGAAAQAQVPAADAPAQGVASSSSSNGVPPAAAGAAAAAAPVVAPPPAAPGAGTAAAPPAKPQPQPQPLGTIHERVEAMEREHQAAAAAAAKQVQQPVKPRATARKPPPSTSTPLDIVFVSAEVAPWSKTGGLGDVMGALPQAMADRGHRVMVVSPRYTNGGKDVARYKDAQAMEKAVWVELNRGWHELKFHVLAQGGVDYVFLEHLSFQREGTPYGNEKGPFQDNLFRFALLCLGALEAPLNLPIKKDRAGKPLNEVYGQDVMFVANDWHAAVLPVLLSARFRPHGVYPAARCCLAIHNLAHQGAYEAHKFGDLGLSGDWYGTLEWQNPDDKARKKTINILKAGIVTSDVLVTVSQGYAAEITGTRQDGRMDILLAQRAPRLRGIVNGIDPTEWDPAADKHLAANYSAADLSGKAACKRALQREMRLPMEPDLPIIGFIGRLDYQKGPDLILDALPALCNLDCQIVLLGSGAADYEARVRQASNDWGWFCRGHVGFSVPLSHKIIAGCDILLMPSRFEPCGLNQMYAMRYGTVPIAHATGGLIDTIQDYNPFSKGEGDGTGWTFAPAAVEPMVAAVSTAVSLFQEQPERWRALQVRGMTGDVSWDRAAAQYDQVLTEAMADVVQFAHKK